LALIKEFARTKAVNLRHRGPSFAKARSFLERPVAFISYDSKDQDDVARPLARALQAKFCPVWFDEFALGVGDSLRDKIESGLKETKKCIVILSPNFLANKRWSKVEFESIFAREIIQEQNVFLPVWHGVTVKDVYEYSPSLSNRKGIQWSLGLEEVVRQLYRKISEEVELPTADFNL
jgi:TIR domain-containing protein